MEPNNKPLDKKMEDEKNDATKPFPNAEKDRAAEINRGGDAASRNYKDEKDAGSEGPDWDRKSDEPDGDTGQNAGVFK